jgi:hypothetical protein
MKNMKKSSIYTITIIILITLPSLPASTEPETQLDIHLYGGLPIPSLFQSTGGIIINTGDTTAYNISWLLIINGTTDNINLIYDGTYQALEPLATSGTSLGITILNVQGFGLISITLSAIATNAEPITKKAYGIQLGKYTWIPLSWIIPPFLKSRIPWLDIEL